MVDLDGTLVDTLGDFVAAVNAMLADLHTPGQAPISLMPRPWNAWSAKARRIS
jgi:phosphoglycolate phosphatase-like HAD superfamily hydrolase